MRHQVDFDDLKDFVTTTTIASSSRDKKSLTMRAWATKGIVFWVAIDGKLMFEDTDLREAINAYNSL